MLDNPRFVAQVRRLRLDDRTLQTHDLKRLPVTVVHKATSSGRRGRRAR